MYRSLTESGVLVLNEYSEESCAVRLRQIVRCVRSLRRFFPENTLFFAPVTRSSSPESVLKDFASCERLPGVDLKKLLSGLPSNRYQVSSPHYFSAGTSPYLSMDGSSRQRTKGFPQCVLNINKVDFYPLGLLHRLEELAVIQRSMLDMKTRLQHDEKEKQVLRQELERMERVVSDREQELQQIHDVQKQSGVRAPLSSISNVAPGVPSTGMGKKVLHWEDIEERATVARQRKQQTIERYKSVLSHCHTLDERKASE
ncbi:MAG: hypothetical protein SGPRY_010260, partial [Prymnesium sp.]